MKRAAPFAVRSNRIRSHAFRFLMECIWKFGSKNVAFLTSQMFASLMIRVSSTFGQSDGCMSDTPETMGGLSGVPNGPSSQTI